MGSVIVSGALEHKTAVIEMLRHSHKAAGFDQDTSAFSFPFDPAYAERVFLAHLVGPALCIVLTVDAIPQGVLMAVAAEHPFGPVKLAKETVWWIERAARGIAAVKMLDAYEKWARDCECRFAGMAGMGDDPEVAKLYRRRGYLAAETHFLKALL